MVPAPMLTFGADRRRRRDRSGASTSSRRRARSSSARRSCRPSRRAPIDALVPQVRERADATRRSPIATSVITQWLRTVTRSPSRELTMRDAAVDLAAAADRSCRPSSDTPGWMIVSAPICDVAIDVGRRRILDRDARRHQLRVLVLVARCGSPSASSARLLMPRISSAFATVTVSTPRPARPVDRDEIGQVVLALGVLGGDARARASNSPSSAKA